MEADSIVHRVTARPINLKERGVLDVYNFIHIVLFGCALSTETVRFLLLLMRINGIAQQQTTIHIERPAMTRETVANYTVLARERMVQMSRSMRS